MNPNPSLATRFQPGQSGNPAGRPRGALNKATLAAMDLMEGQIEAVTQATCKKAIEGSERAQKLVLDRVAPRSSHIPVPIDLPVTDTLDAVLAAHSRLDAAFAAGELSCEQAQTACRLLDSHRRAIETAELASRLEAVEEALGLARG